MSQCIDLTTLIKYEKWLIALTTKGFLESLKFPVDYIAIGKIGER